MRLRPPTRNTLTPPVTGQLREALIEANWGHPFIVMTEPFRLTTRWGWIAGPAHSLVDGAPFPVEIYLHRPANVLSDAAKADRNHVSLLRYTAGGVIVVPVLLALAWLIYMPVPLAGVAVGVAAGWAIWKWLLPKVTVSPIDKAPMTVVEAEPTIEGVITAVRSVSFVQALDDLGTSLPTGGDSDEQYVTEWKAQWQANVDEEAA